MAKPVRALGSRSEARHCGPATPLNTFDSQTCCSLAPQKPSGQTCVIALMERVWSMSKVHHGLNATIREALGPQRDGPSSHNVALLTSRTYLDVDVWGKSFITSEQRNVRIIFQGIRVMDL